MQKNKIFKKTIFGLGIVIVFIILYLFMNENSVFHNFSFLGMIFTIAMPFLISTLIFERRKYWISFPATASLILIMIFVFGADRARILNIDINPYGAITYFFIAVLFLIISFTIVFYRVAIHYLLKNDN